MTDRRFKHTEAHKLEDPARLQWLPPAEVVQRLALRSGTRVADIGAGTGYFSIPIARAVGNTGQVFAIDVQQEMLNMLQAKLEAGAVPNNISLHRGDAAQVPLPHHSVDLVFLANIWHEVDSHSAVLKEAARLLSAEGRIAILDWRPEMPSPPGPPQHHRIGADEASKTLSANGFEVLSSSTLGQFSYLVLAKRAESLP